MYLKMQEKEIMQQFPIDDKHCYACFSVGRKLSLLGKFKSVFLKITEDLEYQNWKPVDEIQVCWECKAYIKKLYKFRQQVNKANETFQLGLSYIYGTQSSLTMVILNDSNQHTVYMNEDTTFKKDRTFKKAEDCDDKFNVEMEDIWEECGVDKEDCVDTEEVDVKVITEHRKPRINRWATQRALQNKKPKFKIITEYSKESFNKIPIQNNTELQSCMKCEKDSEYFKSKKFKCDQCVSIFKSEEFFLNHNKKFHDKTALYTCDICNSRISNKRHLVAHIRRHYYKYACTLCNYICYDKSRRKWHFQRHHRKVFQCLKCELIFGSRREFFKHYKDWHEKFVCDHCGISFKMRYCIKDHIRKQHSPFECKLCNKRWARYNGLWLHNKTYHSEGKAAYCVECDRQYRDIYRYRWHLANSARHRQRKKLRIPCPGCDKIFSKNIYMKDHFNLVHLKHYKYRCEQCDKNFIRNADLVNHTRRIHEGILPPKNKICYMCGRGFTTNKILNNHLRTHTGEKPFACSMCSARFAQSTALSAHTRAIHHRVKQTS